MIFLFKPVAYLNRPIQGNKENLSSNYTFAIVSYKKEKDKARPYLVSYSEVGMGIILKLYDDKIGYKTYSIDEDKTPNEVFSQAVENHKTQTRGFSYIKEIRGIKLPSLKNLPFFVIQQLVLERLNKSIKNNISFSYDINNPKSGVVWIAPIREKPERIYDNIKPDYSPEGTHTPHLLNDLLHRGDKKSDKLKKALNSFGKESGMFREITSKRFGKSEASPFEIDITISKTPIKITNVGYGVSQVLPVIVESFIRKKQSTFCIQQPEVHLHPRAQAALGGFFHDLCRNEDKNFLIETHSDFLIDRFRIGEAKHKKHIPSQVLFFERVKGKNVVHTIKIQKNGQYSEDQPETFRSFFFKEQINILSM